MNYSFRDRLPSPKPAFYYSSLSAFLKSAIFSAVLVLSLSLNISAQTQRLVIIKCDGLPNDVLDHFVNERDLRTGKSELPWIDYVFYQHGTRVRNFYVRGISLSAPSWSMLETGQHLRIKGNVEFDRYTLHTYDYLNFIPFVVNTTAGNRVDMPAVEVMDSLREPLLIDAFSHDERYITFSLFQRGPRFVTYQKSLENRFKRAPRELFDEWATGFSVRDAIPDQLIKEMIDSLNDPKLQYLDVNIPDFDHAAHHNNDRESHLIALQRMDDAIGQIWTAIQKSPLAEHTAVVLVSDHGINSDERVYSQGFNLVKLLGSPEGGGHHVITKRRLLMDYALKAMNPFASLVTTTTPDSYYLKGQSTQYPTAMIDFDGNERASLHLRNSDLNVLHILLQELQRRDLDLQTRKAATEAFFTTLDSHRAAWQVTIDQLNEELAALRLLIEDQRKLWAAQPKKFTKEELELGKDDQSKRIFALLGRWLNADKEYSEYVRVMTNLLSLRRESFAPLKVEIENVIPRQAMGDRNSVYELQNYVIGLSPQGLTLRPDGSLDLQQSFRRLNYFPLLKDVSVRNNVQREISNRPVDMIAMRLSSNLLTDLHERNLTNDAVWVYGGVDKQALILARRDEVGGLSFRYVPVKGLTQDAEGKLHFEMIDWQPDLPLRFYEDRQLNLPLGTQRETWLSGWHTDVEWLRALHKTNYSTGLIGLYEELGQHPLEGIPLDEPGLSNNERLLRRLTKRQRELIESDILIVANDHWNFDVRGFNPGGNHGSFFRISTHSTLMIAGGTKTGIARGAHIDEPYDSLSFVPTMLALTGKLRDDSNPIPALSSIGFRRFPGRVIKELVPEIRITPDIAVTGASAAP